MKKVIIIVFILLTLYSTMVAQEYQVGDHELFLMPTGETMPKGSSYVAIYELFLLNYTYALTSSTHVGVFSIFPFSSGFVKTITISVKQRYLEKGSFKSAAWLTLTPENGLFSIGNVFSFGKKKTNFHLGLGGLTVLENSNHWEVIYMAGLRHRISRRVSLLAEYTNFSTMIDNDYFGFISIGVRLHFNNLAIDFGGVRPLAESGDFLFFPILKATLYLK